MQALPATFYAAMGNMIKYHDRYHNIYPYGGSSGKSDAKTDLLAESLTGNILIGKNEKADSDRISAKLPYLSQAVNILIRIGNLYRTFNVPSAWIGMCCFMFLIFFIIVKRQVDFCAPVLVICGLLFSLCFFMAGMSYTQISSLNTLQHHYLCTGYPLMLGSIWLPILYMIQLVWEKTKESVFSASGSD